LKGSKAPVRYISPPKQILKFVSQALVLSLAVSSVLFEVSAQAATIPEADETFKERKSLAERKADVEPSGSSTPTRSPSLYRGTKMRSHYLS
jgi:hypothetical protein